MGSNMADTDANAQLREEYKQILSSLREKKVLHQRYLNCTTDLLKQLKTCSSHISMIQYFLEIILYTKAFIVGIICPHGIQIKAFRNTKLQ